MPVATPGTTGPSRAPLPEEPALRKLYRSADGRMLGGVARGLAGHLGLPVIWVRLVFLGLFLADGLGAVLYAVFWIVVPLGVGGRAAEPRSVFETTPDGRRRLRKPDKGQLFAMVALLFGAAIFVGSSARVWSWSGGRRTTPAVPAGPTWAAGGGCSSWPGRWPASPSSAWD
jgi:phage shock protein PspC (stress-responsive transcriptional regulator)